MTDRYYRGNLPGESLRVPVQPEKYTLPRYAQCKKRRTDNANHPAGVGGVIEFVQAYWREVIFVLVGLTGVFLVSSVLALIRVGQQHPDSEHDGKISVADVLVEPGIKPAEPIMESSVPNQPSMPNEPLVTKDFLYSMHRAAMVPSVDEIDAPVRKRFFAPTPLKDVADVGGVAHLPRAAENFADELIKSNVEVELQQLRRESAALRDEVLRVREELAGIKASRNVSPLYGEAMSLAQQGVPADGIAGQCGISLGEAELVAALARGEAVDESAGNRLEPVLHETRNVRKRDPRTGTNG